METPIGLTALRQDLTHIIDDVKYAGTQYVIMRYDEPAAALVPIDLYDRWKKEREEISDALRGMSLKRGNTETDRVLADFLLALQAMRNPPGAKDD